MPCIEFSDIIRTNAHQVDVLAEVAEKNPDPAVPGACEAFTRQVRMVESVVASSYVIAIEVTRKSESLEEISDVWQATGGLCNQALEVVSALKDRYPHSGTPELYDRLLDYTLACSRRFDDVNEEILCQTLPTPEGLFPSLT
jgi:hypothetical protein